MYVCHKNSDSYSMVNNTLYCVYEQRILVVFVSTTPTLRMEMGKKWISESPCLTRGSGSTNFHLLMSVVSCLLLHAFPRPSHILTCLFRGQKSHHHNVLDGESRGSNISWGGVPLILPTPTHTSLSCTSSPEF